MESSLVQSALQLSLEQEFNLKAFKQQMDTLSSEEKTNILYEILRQLMIKNNVIRHLVAQNMSPADMTSVDSSL